MSDKTSHGMWVYRKNNQHKCHKPPYNSFVEVGDQWKCADCNQVWEVIKIWHDQRDNYTGMEWDRVDPAIRFRPVDYGG